ncbi:MAG TPA: GTP cyclohydrolase I FolE [Leptospiraceae bacterium]|nr:GTP cyclohydrolase I FolE [Leptospiraceae bacterium]HMW05136.1 GTP cyclohydrolase I FolE [Leptospiraceae bacterium]HMX32603.1 GTP cyclohydrolase I FolE [Leptospiraceae bacterium]HMY32475.1 GTP cyclohydrolase I FolE [Leptospiraceae bacterium]HMZ66615.1 GTP cyclohydrolase I FolE [Leptospiraceae bacterium]
MEDAVKKILTDIGEDPTREGLLDTPKRVKKAYEFLTSGYTTDITKLVNGAIFEEHVEGMVIVRDIELYSLCEHHLLPFFGRAHVAYIPNKKIIGISKIPRIVDVFARRLQVQERLTDQVANAIQEILDPLGVGVIMKAKHMCMMMRGVEKQNSELLTSCMLGEFRDSSITRNEFLDLIRTGQ